MPDAPKTSFWHSIPGLMTGIAGFLSAATGAFMALHQTGVVDAKKLAGAPSEQSTPAELHRGTPPEAALPADKAPVSKPMTTKADNAKLDSEVTKDREQSPVLPARQEDKKSDAAENVQRIADASKPTSPASAPDPKESSPQSKPPSSDTKPPFPEPKPTPPEIKQASPEPKPAVDSTPKETKSQPQPSERKMQPVEIPPPPIPAKTTPTQPAPVERPAERVTERPIEAKRPEPKISPPPPPVQDKIPPKPDERERLADARRVRPDEVPAVGKGKAPAPGAASLPPSGLLDLTGLKMTIPSGWVREEIRPEPMGPVAELRIPGMGGRGEDGVVRITHYMGTKGREFEDRTFDRWLKDVTKPNGAPMSRSDARVLAAQFGQVRLTTLDLVGTVKASPREPSLPDHRMIAAIIDYPKGAHLVTITGPSAAMASWAPSIDAFLKSAKAE